MREQHSFEGAFARGGPDVPFRYVPFTVPAGATRIEVSYHCERPDVERADEVDIGVFDARGAAFLSGGFRGWSGSARSSFFITREAATPGYIRGPILPGEWQLVLACPLRRVEQARYWVDVSVDSDPNAAGDGGVLPDEPVAARPSAPRTGPGRWCRGDFHSHTEHSDGANSIDEYVVEARRVGLDFLAITDHNTWSHFEEIISRPRNDLLLIPGEEVTTSWGHANVWGVGGWVDFRCTDDDGMQRIMDSVHERGGLFSPNHPKAGAGFPWEFDAVRDYRVAEVWQGPWRFHNDESLDFWEQRLRTGAQVVAVGGSDCHAIAPARFVHPWTLGDPCTWVYVQGALDEEGVLDGVRAGHVFVSEDPTGPFLEFTASCAGRDYVTGDTIEAAQDAPVTFGVRYRGPADKKIRLYRNGELWQEAVADREEGEFRFELRLDEPAYVRAVAAGFRGKPERGEVVHALSNPIYLRVAS